MAENKAPSSVLISDKMREELSCDVCLDEKELLLLPCQHRFCRKCLEQIEALEGSRIPCPSCRVDVCVPDGGFPVCRLTALFRNLLTCSATEGGEKVSQSTSDVRENDDQCQLCGGDIDGKCRSCENFLCGRCTLKTKCKKREMRQHDAEDIDDIFSRTSATFEAWKKKEESEVKQLEEKLQELTRIQKLHKEKTAVLESAEIALTACQSITKKIQIMTQLAGTTTDCLPRTSEVADINIKEDTTEEKYSKLVAVHTLGTYSRRHVIGTEDMVPLLYSTEDCSVSLLSKGIKLTHKSTVSIPMNNPASFAYHDSIGLWYYNYSTLNLYDKFRLDSTSEINDELTMLRTIDGTMACSLMDTSHAYVLVKDSSLIKYCLKTVQVDRIIELGEQYSPSTLLAYPANRTLIVVGKSLCGIKIQALENDKPGWTLSVPEMEGFLRMCVYADNSPLFLIAYKTKHHQRGVYPIFGKASLLQIDTVRGRLISEIDISKFLEGKHPSTVKFAAQGDRLWIIEAELITEYMMI